MKFVGLHAAEDAGEGDEDDFAEVVEGVAAATRILDPFKGTEACGEALRIDGFIGISGHPDSVKPLDVVLQIYIPLGIDCLPSVGTLAPPPSASDFDTSESGYHRSTGWTPMKRRMVQSDDRSVPCLIYWDQFCFDVYLRPLSPPMKPRI
jgi:hypothetical protein